MKAQFFKDKQNLWRFRIVAANGEIVATSESYHNKSDAVSTANKLLQGKSDLEKDFDKWNAAVSGETQGE